MKKRLLSVLLGLGMFVVLLTGCVIGGQNQQVTKETKGVESTKEGEVVTLKWYMSLPSVASDTDKVIAQLNEYTREKIGVEIEYLPMSDSDYMEKMPTYVNSGSEWDICFTANWSTDYIQFSQRDAFLDLSTSLPEYAKETWEFIPESLWKSATVNGGIYGVPSYKEMGWQGGLYVNSEMAKAYGIDLSKVKSLQDFTEVLKVVAEKSKAENKKVIGISGLSSPNGFPLLIPYESLMGNGAIPGAAAVKEYGIFTQEEEVFNQYATKEYMDYCKLIYE